MAKFTKSAKRMAIMLRKVRERFVKARQAGYRTRVSRVRLAKVNEEQARAKARKRRFVDESRSLAGKTWDPDYSEVLNAPAMNWDGSVGYQSDQSEPNMA